MSLSFAPLEKDARDVLTNFTGIDFRDADMKDWFCCTARNRKGEVMGVLACEPKTDFDWHFSIALPEPRCLHPKLVRVVFKTLFTGAARITAHIDPDNFHAIEQAQRLGFVYEGFMRRGLDGRRDAALFGMLPEDCVWLAKVHKGVRHGLAA